MNTQYFRYAIEIERTRSISRAAENLYMGQPNLSRAIKELEESLGFSVFKRTSKGVITTEKGAEFIMYAKNIMHQLDNMERLSSAGDNIQTLNASVPRASYISNALVEFVGELSKDEMIDINFKETNAMQSISDVSDGRHNFAIIRYRMQNESYFMDYLEEKKLSFETIWEFERIVLTSIYNKYLRDGIIKYSDLKKCVEILHGDTIVPYHQQGVKPDNTDGTKRIRLYERGNQFEILTSVPEAYIWTSPVPQKYLDRYSLTIAHSDRAGKIYRDVLIYQKGYKFTDVERRFIDKIYLQKNKISL